MAMAQVVMQLHVAQSCKAVEPCVGHRFHGVFKAVFADAFDQLVALATDLRWPGLASNDSDIALRLAWGNFE